MLLFLTCGYKNVALARTVYDSRVRVPSISDRQYSAYTIKVRHHNPSRNYSGIRISRYSLAGRDILQRLGDEERHNRKVDEQKKVKNGAKEISKQSKPPVNITKITQASAADANDLKLLQMQNKDNKKRVANKATKSEKTKENQKKK